MSKKIEKKPQRLNADDLNNFMALKRGLYQQLNEYILSCLASLSTTDEYQRHVYRVYTRADKQQGNSFKEDWKILKAANELLDAGDHLQSFLRVPDIVGVTIVVAYPSDIVLIRKFVDGLIEHGELICFDKKKMGDDGRGYEAFHYRLGRPHTDFQSMRCEIQIKTVLHDAWSAKTHGMTYKPEVVVDERLDRQVSELGQILSHIDRQSEIIKDMISEQQQHDEIRRNNALQAMLLQTPLHVNEELFLRIREKIRVLSRTERKQNDPRVQEILDDILNARRANQSNWNRDICHLQATLAFVPRDEAMKHTCFRNIDDWYIEARSKLEQFNAKRYKAYALYAFNEIEEAIHTVEEIMKFRSKMRTKQYTKGLADVMNNLAYAYAELVGTATGERLRAVPKAQACAAQLMALAPRIPPEAVGHPRVEELYKDTQGFVYIMCGGTVEKIEEGRRICREAAAGTSEEYREAQRLFLELHESRALRRLVGIDKARIMGEVA